MKKTHPETNQLTISPPGKLTKKLAKIREPWLFRRYHEGLGFCHLSLQLMTHYQHRFRREMAHFPGHPNRVYYLAEKIKVIGNSYSVCVYFSCLFFACPFFFMPIFFMPMCVFDIVN